MKSPFVLMLFAGMLLSGCASQGNGATLTIDTRDLEAPQNIQVEISRMMEILGYEWLPVYDPVTRRRGKIGQQHGEYRMLYQFRDDQHIRVDVHIREADGRIRLRFHEEGQTTPGESALRHYQKLRDRAFNQFGKENVRAEYPALAP